jgi:integrase
LRGSRKGGKLTAAGMTPVGVGKRVQQLGETVGIANLSPHDCRHYWATYWARRADRLPKGLFTLQESGGWRSLAMPRRYVEESTVVNEGMV